MNRSIRRMTRLVIVLAIAVSLTPVVGYAQRRAKPPRLAGRSLQQSPPPQAGPESASDPADGPNGQQPRLPNRWELLGRGLQTLDLSPEQRRTIRLVRDRNDVRMREYGRRYLDANRQLEEILFSQTPDMARARTLSLDLASVVGERTSARVAIELEVLKVLTPAQRAELRGLREQLADRVRDEFRDRRMERKQERRDERRNRKFNQPRPEPQPTPAPQEPVDEPEMEESPPGDPGGGVPEPGRPSGAGQRPMRGPEIVRTLNLTPEQNRGLLDVRRRFALPLRELNQTFFRTQQALDMALLADEIAVTNVERLGAELGRIDTEREQVKFDIEASLRGVLSAEQYRMFWRLRRAPRNNPNPQPNERKLPKRPGLPPVDRPL